MNAYSYPCIGALIGDTVGSVYEFDNIKTTDFPLFSRKSNYTDDSVMTMAVASWLVSTDRSQSSLEAKLVDFAMRTPCPMGGYGGNFRTWLFCPERLLDFEGKAYQDGKRHPYNSFGNGSAMRASACGWVAQSLEEALELAKQSAEITHNHPEGIKGAQAVAAAVYMARYGDYLTLTTAGEQFSIINSQLSISVMSVTLKQIFGQIIWVSGFMTFAFLLLDIPRVRTGIEKVPYWPVYGIKMLARLR